MMDKNKVIDALKTCLDPELGVDVWTLGLIYKVDVTNQAIDITMTFTTPLCPYGPMLVESIKTKLIEAGAEKVNVNITFDPAWQPSNELKEMLGMEQ